MRIVAAIVLIIFYFKYRRVLKFKCGQCGHKQSKHKVVGETSSTTLVHGRWTKSGNHDKRYNNRYGEKVTTTYGITCNKCGTYYTTVSPDETKSYGCLIIIAILTIVYFLARRQ